MLQWLSIILAALVITACASTPPPKPDPAPELSTIQDIIDLKQEPAGIIFVIREYDESALTWILPRLLYYSNLLRERYPALSIATVSHGDEILSLTTVNLNKYPDTHTTIKRLVELLDVEFHICGTFAEYNGLTEQDFPEYIDVVPFGPAQIADYVSLGYELIDLELTW